MNMSDRVVVDGRTAVLVSPGYGAGWSTYSSFPSVSLFHPAFVAWVLDGKKEDIEDIAKMVFEEDDVPYLGGADNLVIRWIPQGTDFYIREYDGFEHVVFPSDLNWHTA